MSTFPENALAASLGYVVHRTAARIRIKIPDRQGQRAYFGAIERSLIGTPGILRVDVNPLTASVVIRCREGFDVMSLDAAACGFKPSLDPPAEPERAGIGASVGNDNLRPAHFASRLIFALATNQLGVQIIEWAVEALMDASLQGKDRISAGPPISALPTTFSVDARN